MIVAPDGQPFGEQNPAYRSSLAPFLKSRDQQRPWDRETETFTGSIDLSLAVLHRVPLGSIVGSFTIMQIAIRRRRAGPAPAARGPALQGNLSDAVRDGQVSFGP